MIHSKILLTSFQTWLPHQKSNSSDDLLEQIKDLKIPDKKLFFLRNLPVNTQSASSLTIKTIQNINPDVVICCGMAEGSSFLRLESQAFYENKHYKTNINLTQLAQNLKTTIISEDAGKFVCEGLYFHVLEYLYSLENIKGLFVHIPILTPENNTLILEDFKSILMGILNK